MIPEEGRILISDVDIATIPLPVLRRNIAIIPQDPTLFLGSVRSNVDRFNECTDEQVWSALQRVGTAKAAIHSRGRRYIAAPRTVVILAKGGYSASRLFRLHSFHQRRPILWIPGFAEHDAEVGWATKCA